MDSVLQDLRYSLRTLLKTPGPMLLAIFALTLGIGANSALFSVVNTVLLRPLSYAEPGRLVVLWEANPSKNIREFFVSPPDFKDWLAQSRSFEIFAAFRPHPSTLTGGTLPERVEAASVSPRIFELLGAPMALGRPFLADEDQPGREHSVLLSHALWQRRFNGDRSILDRPIQLDGAVYSVVGVTAPGFRLLDSPSELWTPYTLDSKEMKERGFHTLKVIARLEPGVSLAQATQEMRAIASGLERQFPDTNSGWTVDPVLLRDQMTGNIRPTLWTLFGAVGFVLLIACSNVAILLLTLAGGRQKEIAVRAALGASHLRVMRQMLTESVALSMVSGILGLALAYGGIRLLRALKPANLPRLDEIRVDARAAAFTLAVCVLTGILFGMFPAITATKSRLNELLRVAGRSSMSSIQSRRTRGLLVIAEIALSVALLIGASLMIRSFAQLQSVDPGFRPSHVLTMEIALPESRYKELKVALFFRQLLERVARLPGVESAGVARNVPLSGSDPSLNFVIENRPPLPSAEQPRAKYRAVSAGYFQAMGIPLKRGRAFTESDGVEAPKVVIINETLAQRFWPGQDPVGSRMKAGFDESSWCTIAGVVGNVKHARLDAETNAEMYYPYLQVPPTLMNFIEGSMTIAIRTARDPSSLAGAVRSEVQALDPDQPVSHIQTMEQIVNGSIAQPRFRAVLLGVFAGIALLLAVIGLYGVVSHSVSQRSSELGLRAALGASQSDLQRLVLGEGARLAIAGVLIGLAIAFGLLRIVSSFLFGIRPADPVTFIGVPALLLLVALAAAYIPARRASRADPVVAMR